ncbi:peptidase [Fragilaria crotonensis]|nr:peptidase [Fragilaria crotonensis]
MKSLLLRNWGIVAILLQCVSATATLLANNEDLHIKEETRAENAHDLNSRRVQTNRIVGGNQATKGEYPYFVQWERGCGASLIHSDIILSAAHCNGSNLPTGVIVSAYQNDRAIDGAQARTIVQRVQHPNYDSSTEKNDFLIMRLDSPVTGSHPNRP